MRLVAAVAGFVLSVPPLIFFWIGSQTFLRFWEKALAMAVTVETAALLALSVALFFTPTVHRIQALLLVATFVTVVFILAGYHLLK